MNAEASAKAARPHTTPGRIAAENIECLAIAIVMALILKFFLLEAYKIPTSSMQPTIMGDAEKGIFDRVLVNKLVYLLRDPERFEVVVFKMPLVQRQNYIKRLVGLPGETVRIAHGDLFVTPPGGKPEDESIVRKSDKVWHAVRKQLLPVPGSDPRLNSAFQRHAGQPRIEADSVTLSAAGDEDGCWVELRQPIRDRYYDGYPKELVGGQGNRDSNEVSDIEIGGEIEVQSDDLRVVIVLHATHLDHRLELDVGAGRWTCASQEPPRRRRRPSEAEPVFTESGEFEVHTAGNSLEFSFRHVDQQVVVVLDGEELGRFPYEHPHRSRDSRAVKVSFGAEQGQCQVAEVQLWRDIHYTNKSADPERFLVPEDSFFLLGDNTTASYDGRSWKVGEYDIDGTVVRGNLLDNPTDPNPRMLPGGGFQFENLFGEVYSVDSTRPDRSEEFHFVHRRFLLGKALAVFWPLPPVSPVWRLGWVR